MEPYKKYSESIRICAKTLHVDESGIGIIESLVNHVIKETLNEATEDKKAPGIESIEEQMNKPRFELHPAWSEDEYILASEIWKILKSEAGTSGKKRVIEEIRKHDSNVVQRYEAMIGALEAVTDLMILPTDEDKVEQFYEALEKYNLLKLKK